MTTPRTTTDMVAQYHEAIMASMRDIGQSVDRLSTDFTCFRNEDWVRLLVDFGRLSGRVDSQQEKLETHISENKTGVSNWITLGIAMAGVIASALLAHFGKH